MLSSEKVWKPEYLGLTYQLQDIKGDMEGDTDSAPFTTLSLPLQHPTSRSQHLLSGHQSTLLPATQPGSAKGPWDRLQQ